MFHIAITYIYIKLIGKPINQFCDVKIFFSGKIDYMIKFSSCLLIAARQ